MDDIRLNGNKLNDFELSQIKKFPCFRWDSTISDGNIRMTGSYRCIPSSVLLFRIF
jgi:hypothetical protein